MSAHEQALERLHIDRQLVWGLLETAVYAIVVVDQSGRIVLLNAAAEQLFGYARDELVGEPVEILVPERLRHTHGARRERFTAGALTRPMGIGLDLVARRKDGSEFAVEIGLSRLQTDRGVLISAAVSDISERQKTETAIAQLAAIVESSDDAIIAETLDGTITSWNPAAQRIYGYTAAQAVGRHINMLCPSSEQEDEIAGILRRVACGERVDHFETERRRKDGSVIDVSATISPIRERAGEVAGASTTARDVTKRKRDVDALAEAEERFRGAFDGAPIGMALLELNTRFAKVNSALCQITGSSSQQLQGTRLEAIMDPDDADEVPGALRALREGEQTLYTSEKRLLHACGRSVLIALQVTLIRRGDGSPLRFLAQIQDITARKRYEERLQDLADHDALTGLLNRRSFTGELDSQADRVNRYGPEGALLILDLDHFKYVNDTLGHHAGDQIIISAAQALAGRLRKSDVLARLGGDEFAVLLPKGDATAAKRLAAQLLDTLTAAPLTTTGAGARAITASIGIATFQAQLTGENLLVHADLAMYDAKEAGRNRISLYDSDGHNQGPMKGRLSWVGRIRSAFEQDRFTLLAQPIIDYSTGLTSQHELLLRMADEHGDLIAPAAFIHIAERFDMIGEIDAWVVRNAIRLLADSDGLRDGLPLHVNLSGRSLGDPKLLQLIEHELNQAAVPPSKLIIEITETAAITHITHAKSFSERLTELGCRLALDDFGSGFGSFYYLKHLPFDFLKIDGEFIRNCTNSKTDRLVIQAVVGIAQGLGKRTIAEFVQDQETVRLLIRLGVDYGQGYHHGRPAPLPKEVTVDGRCP